MMITNGRGKYIINKRFNVGLLTSFPVPSRDHSTTCITVHIFSVLMIAHCWHLEGIVSVLNAVFSCIQ